ncbi:uncharacterized protein LOC108631409 isoform X2 [Ceratina calcarata]|nr:uncharacterized protein LOC108631409 isoform X2 [Ceratina calcarata]
MVSSDSAILNNTIYGIANVNVVSRSEIWKLSENYIKPRAFIKLDRYEQMHQNYINFRGKELQVCSTYKPPMTFFNRTIKKMIDGAEEEVFAMDSDSDWDGIEMHLFLAVAKKLNFTWTIRKPKGNYTYGRRFNETVWEGGIIQLLTERKVDIAFANIFITLDQYSFVDMSPWYEIYIHFLVPRPRRTTSFWALTRPFTAQVWYLLATVLLLHSLYTYIRTKIDPQFAKQFQNFLIILIDLIGYLLSSLVPKVPTTNKLQILLWRTAGWLIITAYCSSLAARLSSWDYEPRIDTVEQFIQANLTWTRSGEPPPFEDFFNLKDPYAAQLPNKYYHIDNESQIQMIIAQGNYALLGNTIDTWFFPTNYVPNEELKNYRLMRQSLGHYHNAFAVQPWLLKPINMIMLLLRETGITNWHLRDVIRRRNSYYLRQVLVEHDKYDGSVQVLGLTPLGAGFSLLLIGLSIATFVFYLEIRRIPKAVSTLKLIRDE